MQTTAPHYHVGHNTPGYLPDSPDTVSTDLTVADALISYQAEADWHSDAIADSLLAGDYRDPSGRVDIEDIIAGNAGLVELALDEDSRRSLEHRGEASALLEDGSLGTVVWVIACTDAECLVALDMVGADETGGNNE